MDILELMKRRHSVRQYKTDRIEDEKRAELDSLCREINEKSGMSIRIVYDEPVCFDSPMAHYGKFTGCRNYIDVIGPKGADLDEKAGYYGEQLVLKAQELGLNTCWAALTHGKSAAKPGPGEKSSIIIALGYGQHRGLPRKSRPVSEVSNMTDNSPEWFRRGMEAVMLAPTAVNQQHFRVNLAEDGSVSIRSTGGICSKIDLGIVKWHFEAVTGVKAL
ncbi:MAG: nitroreductase [Clostridia bacterium]|nr:nitroreductase [Clostridia bacterium]